MMDGTWLEEEWYELCDTVYAFKQLLGQRGIVVTERKDFNGGELKLSPRYRIRIRRDASDPEKLVYLIHEFVHFELGHREDRSQGGRASGEIEACLVAHIVNWMFYLKCSNDTYICEQSWWMPGIYRKAYGIACQLLQIFPNGRIPANHNTLMR
jgi:hypothetical protein